MESQHLCCFRWCVRIIWYSSMYLLVGQAQCMIQECLETLLCTKLLIISSLVTNICLEMEVILYSGMTLFNIRAIAGGRGNQNLPISGKSIRERGVVRTPSNSFISPQQLANALLSSQIRRKGDGGHVCTSVCIYMWEGREGGQGRGYMLFILFKLSFYFIFDAWF